MRNPAVVLGLCVLLLGGCGRNIVFAGAPARPPVLISFDVPGTGLSLAYLIDPTTESCFLRDGGLTPVDCALLAKNLPQAAQHITWGARESDVTPVAPTAPPAEPTAPTAESEPR
jgi:hypothetical protein